MKSPGEFIQEEYLDKYKISLDDFAELLKWDRRKVYQFLRDKYTLSDEDLEDIQEVLGLPAQVLGAYVDTYWRSGG